MTELMMDDRMEVIDWDAIDAVVFDVGNVLLTFSPQKLLEEIVPEVPQLHPILMRKVFRSPYWVTQDHGTATPEEATVRMIGRDAYLEPYIRRIMENWVQMKTVIPEGVETLKRCKAHGKKVYVLSNYGDSAFDVVWNKYEFFRLFDGIVISARIRLMKPQEDIYRYVEKTYGVVPERTLFIDDMAGNVYGAMCAGWQGIVYDEPGKLERFFAD